MTQYKNQHYVPQFYLRYFSNNNIIQSYNIKTKICYPMNCRNVCSSDYFYSRIPETERAFSKIEGEWNRIITALKAENNTSEIDTQDYCIFLFFILFQYSRTLGFKHESEKYFNYVYNYFFRLWVKENSDRLAEDGLDMDYLEKCKIVINGPIHAVAMKDLFEKGPFLIRDLISILLINSTERDFIISDSPVVLYNSFFNNPEGHFLYPQCSTTGLQSPGLQIFCPLGPKHMLVLYDKEFYNFGNSSCGIIEIYDEKDIDALNVLQIFNCNNIILFANHEQRENLRTLHTIYEKYVNNKVRNTETIIKKESFGTKRERAVIINNRDIDYKLELSFMIFNPNAKAIDIARDFSIVDFVKQYFDSQENEIDMLFYAGEIIVEPGADKILFLERPDEDLTDILERHVCGDWGEVCQEEKKRNDKALQDGSKIISAYTLSSAL